MDNKEIPSRISGWKAKKAKTCRSIFFKGRKSSNENKIKKLEQSLVDLSCSFNMIYKQRILKMDNKEIPSWMQQLSQEKTKKEFSQLCHDYYKLACMRIMQDIRKKFNVPKEDIPTLHVFIFAKMLNETVYSVGANIKNNYPINNLFSKEHLLLLVRVLNGEPLDQMSREDIETDIQKGLLKFQEFILKNASDFYI